MTSAWFGLNTGLRALVASQLALDTAAHNTANANTAGYSRQRVHLVASDPFSFPAFNRTGLPGQIGTGVSVATIERVRDVFLDLQIRSQFALQGQWETRRDELSKVESVFPEPGGSGLGDVLGRFWNAWQDLAADPTSTAARAAVVEQASTLTQRFARDAAQLTTLVDGANFQVDQQVAQVNDLATQIASLNSQIQRVSVSGDHANDLADQRDLLLDQLNRILPVTMDPKADGTVTVLVAGTALVEHDVARTMTTIPDGNGHSVPTWSSGGSVSLGTGQLGALISVRDTTLVGYQAQLDALAQGVADAVNRLHQTGVDATGAAGLDFFTYDKTKGIAATIAVNPLIAADPRLVATAALANQPGDGSIAGLIADLRASRFSLLGGTAAANLVPGDVLATGGSATVSSMFVAGAAAQGYTFSSALAGTLTLTGADGSTQTIAIAGMAAGEAQVFNFSRLGVSITLQATGAKTAADIVTDLTAAGNSTISVGAGTQTASDFYAGLVGLIGSNSRQASEMAANQALVVDHLETRRESISGVSLDEEAIDMIRFQHAYQAASRVITVVDEMLDTLINRTGLVGR